MSTRRRRNKRSQPKNRPIILSPEQRPSNLSAELRAAYEQFASEVAHARTLADKEALVSHRPAVDHLDLSGAVDILHSNPALMSYFKTIVEREQAVAEVKQYGAAATQRRYGFDTAGITTKQPPHITEMPASATGVRPMSAGKQTYSQHDTDSVPNAGFLRQWAEQVEWVRAAINIRREQVGRATIVCRPVDETKPYNKAIQAQVEAILEDPNEYRDSMRTIVEQAVEDLLVLDRGVIEKSMTPKRVPTAIYASDGSLFKIYTGWSGNPDEPRYVYEDSWMNMKVPLRNDEVIMMSANPATYRFGLSPVQVLRKAILSDIKATESAMQLVEGKPPQHIVQLPRASKTDLNNVRDLYEANIAGKRELLFIGGEEKISLFPLMFSAKDNQWLEWQQYLALKIATIFQISPQQLGLTMNINKANGQVQQELYEDTGLIPLMLLVEEFLNRELLADFAPKNKQGRPNMQALNLQLMYPEISEADRILHAERIINMSKNALGGNMPSATLNQVLEMRGEEPVPGGDAFWVYTSRNGQVPWLSYDPNFDWLAANGLNPDGSRAAPPLAATPGSTDAADSSSLSTVDEQTDRGANDQTENAKGGKGKVAPAPTPTAQQLEEKPGAETTPPASEANTPPPAAPTKSIHSHFVDARRSGRRWSAGIQRDYRRQLQQVETEEQVASELEEKIRKKLLEEFADLFRAARQRKAQAAGRLNEPTKEFNPDTAPNEQQLAATPERRKAAQQPVSPSAADAKSKTPAWVAEPRGQLESDLQAWYAAVIERAKSHLSDTPAQDMDAVKAAFVPTAAERAQLTEMIYAAVLQTYKNTYVAHGKAVHATNVPSTFEPDAGTAASLLQSTSDDADGIQKTFMDDLDREIGYLSSQGSSEDDIDRAQDAMAEYVTGLAVWKVLQIANAETSMGADSASNDFVDAIQSGVITLADEYNGRAVVVAVLPVESSNDICAQWAGTYTSLDNYDDVPDFPIHPNCIHTKHIAFEDEVS